jgi:hypothetical protein
MRLGWARGPVGAAVLAGLVWAGPAGVARAQPNPAQQSNKLEFAAAAGEADKTAADKAKQFLTDPANKAQVAKSVGDRTPPPFPGSRAAVKALNMGPRPELIAGLVALPQLSLPDLLSAAVQASAAAAKAKGPGTPAGPTYRWVRLSDRQVRLLQLASPPTDEGDDKVKESWKKLQAAFAAGQPAEHPTRGFLVLRRAGGAAQAPSEFFLFVKEAPTEQLITERNLKSVRAVPDEARPTLYVQLDQPGKEMLTKWTEANAPKNDVYHYLVMVVGSEVREIFKLTEPITEGQMRIGGRYTRSEILGLANDLRNAMPPPSAP